MDQFNLHVHGRVNTRHDARNATSYREVGAIVSEAGVQVQFCRDTTLLVTRNAVCRQHIGVVVECDILACCANLSKSAADQRDQDYRMSHHVDANLLRMSGTCEIDLRPTPEAVRNGCLISVK